VAVLVAGDGVEPAVLAGVEGTGAPDDGDGVATGLAVGLAHALTSTIALTAEAQVDAVRCLPTSA